MEILKDIVGNYWKNVVILVLLLVIFKNCEPQKKTIVKRSVKEIIRIQYRTQERIKVVTKYKIPQINNYYKERYNLPSIGNDSTIVLSDTVAKLNIIELEQKDGCFEELEVVKENAKEADSLANHFENQFKKETRKKSFWKTTAGAVIIAAGLIILTK